MDSVVLNRYAKALFLIAKKDNRLKEINIESEFLIDIFSNQKIAKRVLKNPVLGCQKKILMLQKTFQNNLSGLMQKFISIVIKKGRYRHLVPILNQYIELYKKEMNITSLELVTARKINENLKQTINHKLRGQENVVFKETIDPSIMGGVLIKLNDLQFDATVKNKLNNVRKTFKI